MKVALFKSEGDLTLPVDAAIDMMLWLPQRYEYNHIIYRNLKKQIANSKDNIVILSDSCFHEKRFRTNPSFIDAIIKWQVPTYEIVEHKCEYFDIINFESGNERILEPDLSNFTKSYIQEIDTYNW